MADVRQAAVTLKGNPVDLLGPALKVGDAAPDFVAQATDLSEHTLGSTAGSVRIYNVVPSLDTGVCATQTKRFNEEAARLPAGVGVITVSADLPFAQARWCGAEGVERVASISDHLRGSFGLAYGTLIASGPLERCNARAVFVVDKTDKLRHVEYVPEIGNEPDYDAALAAAKAAASA